jgi:purine-binding chemotaxis protein CheW
MDGLHRPAAATAAAHHGTGEQRQVLTFLLGAELFCIDILSIREIIWYEMPTAVPTMPACIRGVINLRGSVVPVMDLSVRFGRAHVAANKSTCIVIIEVPSAEAVEDGSGRQLMGVVVDAVQAVLDVPVTEIEPAPTFGAKIRGDFIEGICKVNGKFVILLSVTRVLSPAEISAMGEAVASGAEPVHG